MVTTTDSCTFIDALPLRAATVISRPSAERSTFKPVSLGVHQIKSVLSAAVAADSGVEGRRGKRMLPSPYSLKATGGMGFILAHSRFWYLDM